MSDRILTPEEISALLDGTTEGDWRTHGSTPWGSQVVFNKSGEMFVGVSAFTAVPTIGWSPEARERAFELGSRKVADARLIAAAPDLARTALAAMAVAERLREIHKPMDTEAEFWSDGPGEVEHDERFPLCPAVKANDDALCEGHAAVVQVCQECGYEHDDGMAVYRPWPCPSIALLAALEGASDE